MHRVRAIRLKRRAVDKKRRGRLEKMVIAARPAMKRVMATYSVNGRGNGRRSLCIIFAAAVRKRPARRRCTINHFTLLIGLQN